MAYIGRDTDKISNVEVLDNITFDGSSSYTLQKGGSNFTPSSANTLLVSINGVVQAGNFTVSGSTIDFGTAVAGTSTCDFILHYGVGLITAPSDGTVTTAKLADSSVSLAKLTATGTKDATTFLRGDNTFAEPSGGGITMADQWRLSADKTNIDAPATVFDSNLERIDTTGQGTIGSAMSESSGIFTFPSTGIYWVNAFASFQKNADRRYCGLNILVTTNNSSYSEVATSWGHIKLTESDDTYSNVAINSYVDVTDTANVKVKFSADSVSGNSISAIGRTNSNTTAFTFIRLGDT